MNNLDDVKEKKLQKNLVNTKKCSTFAPGEMAEWSIAAVLKTVELRGSGGSNPSLSAVKGVNQVVTRFTPFFTPKNKGWVYFFLNF